MTTKDVSDIARAFADETQDRRIKQGYLRWLTGCTTVLDVGCGTGALLDVLRDAGLQGRGIDSSPAAVATCRSRGHDVVEGRADSVLPQCLARGERYDAIALVHLIEHMDGERALALIGHCARLLEVGGILLIVTPNMRNQIVLEQTFWLDCTHVRPYPRLLLAGLCTAAGLEVQMSLDDPNSVPRRPAFKRVLAKLRSLLSGADRSSGMDAVVVACRT